jgi:hypothetical protein
LQPRQHARQDIRCKRWDDPQSKFAAEHVAVAGEIDQVARGGDNVLGALRDLDAGFGESNLARTPLDEFRPNLALKFPDLHGERRLGHCAVFSSAAEMPVPGERDQIPQLTQSDHIDKLVLSTGLINMIRPDDPGGVQQL